MFTKNGAALAAAVAAVIYLLLAWALGALPAFGAVNVILAAGVGAAVLGVVGGMLVEDMMMCHYLRCSSCFRVPRTTLVQRFVAAMVEFFAVLFQHMRWLSSLFFWGLMGAGLVLIALLGGQVSSLITGEAHTIGWYIKSLVCTFGGGFSVYAIVSVCHMAPDFAADIDRAVELERARNRVFDPYRMPFRSH